MLRLGIAGERGAFAQEDLAFGVAVEAGTAAAGRERAALYDKYAAAVERVQAGFESKGDLANALKAREEAGRAREQRVLGSAAIPGMEKLRGIMEVELATFSPHDTTVK